MSSHHIVREKQEPALLVLGLDNFPEEMLGQLLEWSPTVIATAQTADNLVSRGIKIDWIITDGTAEVPQSDVKLMSCGDCNLSDAALEFLAGNEYSAVNIIADEFKLEDYEPFADKINLVIFNEHQKIYPIVSGFSKWKQTGEMIRILGPADDLILNGLEKITDQVFETIADGFFTICFNQPFLFIAEDL
ncbi:thiamine diphosphokinase [Mucilaginibacter gotjawali]|uniref:Thiamine pyrophosphokinase n=1 Tax=Mucilaginibacter gotjawali TaxID=1550579 RepID=A0A839S9U5_9SPHI|nr:thiamine diphosphokinase [Mucilaginibacter gotjawali]MBB3054775.1 thiamine pyrophosphokinase [Mucilaginibacter gotjawali]